MSGISSIWCIPIFKEVIDMMQFFCQPQAKKGKLIYKGNVLSSMSMYLDTLRNAPKLKLMEPINLNWEVRLKKSKDFLMQAKQVRQNFNLSMEYFLESMDALNYLEKNGIPIEQGFAAFSDRAVLCVENLISCIFLVITDSKGIFSVGMHIDKYITEASISLMIENFLYQLGVPKEEHSQYQLCAHMVGGDETSEPILVSIYNVLSQYSMNLGDLLLTMDNYSPEDRPDRPCKIAYDPQIQMFYEAAVPCSSQMKKDVANYFSFYYIINTLPDMLLFKADSKKPLVLSELEKMTGLSQYMIISHKNTLYRFNNEQHVIKKLEASDSLTKAAITEVLVHMENIEEGNWLKLKPEEVSPFTNMLFSPKRDLRLMASDKEKVFETFPIIYSQEGRELLRHYFQMDFCNLLHLPQDCCSPGEQPFLELKQRIGMGDAFILHGINLFYLDARAEKLIAIDTQDKRYPALQALVAAVEKDEVPRLAFDAELRIIQSIVPEREPATVERVHRDRFFTFLHYLNLGKLSPTDTTNLLRLHFNHMEIFNTNCSVSYLKAPYTLLADSYKTKRTEYVQACFFNQLTNNRAETDTIVSTIGAYLVEPSLS
jgi:hypothetical protein